MLRPSVKSIILIYENSDLETYIEICKLKAGMPGGSTFLLKGTDIHQKPSTAQWQLKTFIVSISIDYIYTMLTTISS